MMRTLPIILMLGGVSVVAETESPTDAVVAVIKEYERAANSRDTAAFRKVLALNDSRFREIEDHIPEPFGSEAANDILQWVDAHPDFDYTVRYRDIQAFLLSDEVAYAVAMHDWESPNGKGTGRTTFVMLRKGTGDWRIIHGHWSAVPPEGE